MYSICLCILVCVSIMFESNTVFFLRILNLLLLVSARTRASSLFIISNTFFMNFSVIDYFAFVRLQGSLLDNMLFYVLCFCSCWHDVQYVRKQAHVGCKFSHGRFAPGNPTSLSCINNEKITWFSQFYITDVFSFFLYLLLLSCLIRCYLYFSHRGLWKNLTFECPECNWKTESQYFDGEPFYQKNKLG